MIEDIDGRLTSKRTREEEIDLLRRDFAQLSEPEKQALKAMMREIGDPAFMDVDQANEIGGPVRILDAIKDAEFLREPVPIRQFISDPYYLGETCQDFYPELLPDMEELFAGGYSEVILTGSIGWGKTFFASIAVCRMLYEISCLRNPHRSFGIAAKTNLAVVALSISESLAIKVIFENIATKLTASPYFQEYYPYEDTKKEMRFPNNVWVAARASTDNSALGLNVFGAIIDEGNFMAPAKKGSGGSRFGKKDQAELLYDKLKRRMKSRFQRNGRLPGMMIVVSSKNTGEDFTRKIVEDQKDDPDVFVRDYALWDVKSDRYSKKKFKVLVGNENVPSKILLPEEVIEIQDNLQEGMHIIDVPVDFRPDFENDIEGSIRDIAGVETVSVQPFIQQRDRIASCINNEAFPQRKHPFDVVEWDQSKPGGFQWSRIAHEVDIRDGGQTFKAWQPKFYPGHTRHIHIDPSLNSDATGFACGCVIGYTEVRRRDRDNIQEVYTESAPVIWIDFMLRVVPPVGGEINFGKIRSLAYQLQNHGFPLGLATMDQYNSADTMQKFAVKGIEAERLSLDRTMDPYDTLKAAIYESRVHMYQYKPARDELQALQRDNVKNKVDHPQKGSKDVSDAVAGVVFSLTTNYRGGPLDIVKGISSYGGMDAEEQRVMVKRDQTGDEDEVMLPFITG
jgi:hypothetical protein